MISRPKPLPTRRQAIARCLLAPAIALACGSILAAAMLVPAPAPVLPLVILVCIGYPMLAACELPAAVAVIAATGSAHTRRDLGRLLRELDRLPETSHPLGL
jgi:hypothetical protein